MYAPENILPATRTRPGLRKTWLLILACLAVSFLSCGLKNYLVFLLKGGPLCPYFCSSTFIAGDSQNLLMMYLFEAEQWVHDGLHQMVTLVVTDKLKITTSILLIPVVEELLFRGPLFLTREHSHKPLWWLFGISLTLLFAVSHGRSGLSLLPLIVFGCLSLWLVSETRRLWPSIALHILFNFFFTSLLVYQSIWASD